LASRLIALVLAALGLPLFSALLATLLSSFLRLTTTAALRRLRLLMLLPAAGAARRSAARHALRRGDGDAGRQYGRRHQQFVPRLSLQNVPLVSVCFAHFVLSPARVSPLIRKQSHGSAVPNSAWNSRSSEVSSIQGFVRSVVRLKVSQRHRDGPRRAPQSAARISCQLCCCIARGVLAH
jgi:hypothetical protein